MKIKVKELEKLIKKALRKKYDRKTTQKITEVILFGELSGKKSHGVVRLVKGGSSMLAQEPTGKPKVVKKSKLSRLIESNSNPAMLIGQIAVDEAIKLAKKYGFGIVGTKGTFSTSGCLSFYLERIAREGLIGVIMAQSPLSTAPFNSIEPLLGTNPVSFGIPTKSKPFIFDMGTSAISYGELLKADSLGKKIPEGVALDENGKMTTSAKEAMSGALLPFDGSYKGSGLSMIVEIFGGLWPGADFVGLNTAGGWGNVVFVYDPELLMEKNDFENKMEMLINRIRNSKTLDGNKVRIPGETTLENRDNAFKKGYVEVDDRLIELVTNYTKTGLL